MKYDFETLVNRRNTGSHKWEGMYAQIPDAKDGIVPLSVADMVKTYYEELNITEVEHLYNYLFNVEEE